MTTTEPSTLKLPTSPPPSETSSNKKSKKKKIPTSTAEISENRPAHCKTKVVVRCLPPNLPEPVFWDAVKDWVNEITADWSCFYAGKVSTS